MQACLWLRTASMCSWAHRPLKAGASNNPGSLANHPAYSFSNPHLNRTVHVSILLRLTPNKPNSPILQPPKNAHRVLHDGLKQAGAAQRVSQRQVALGRLRAVVKLLGPLAAFGAMEQRGRAGLQFQL